MKIESLMKEVAGIADDLSSMGAVKAAQSVDGVLLKIANETIVMDEVAIKGRTPEQKKAIVKQLNSKVQAYINEILKYQGKPPTSTGDGRMTPGDMEWLKQNVGGYKTWGELFQKLKPLLGQAESLEAVPPDFENPAQKMNEHYDGKLKEDVSTMRGDTAKYTKSLGA